MALTEENKYLVLLRCTMDDIPLRLCDSSEEAHRVAMAADRNVPKEIEKAFGYPTSETSGISIVRIVNGHVVGVEPVRNFDMEL